MKFLDIPSLSLLASALSYSSPECKVHARIEAYSCKEVKKERRLRKELEVGWREEVGGVDELSLSPEDKHPLLSSPLGHLSAPESRKIQFLLVSTLNLAYADYDFSHLTPDDFEREASGVVGVLAALSRVVQGGVGGSGSSPRSYGSYPTAILTPPQYSSSLPMNSSLNNHFDVTNITHPTIHRILNDVIPLDECVVYSYTPNAECDPHADDYDPDDEDLDGTTVFGEGGGDGDGEEEETLNMRSAGESDSEDMLMDMEMDDDEDTERKRRSRSVGGGARGEMKYTAARAEGGLLWSVNHFFYCKRQRRILFISVWARKRGSSFLTPQIPIAYNPFKQPPIHLSSKFMPTPSSMPSSMPSLTGLASSIQQHSHSFLGNDGIMIGQGEKYSPSPRKDIPGAGPRRRRRSESVASNISGHSIRARGKRLKA